jgi:hypothetical protein
MTVLPFNPAARVLEVSWPFFAIAAALAVSLLVRSVWTAFSTKAIRAGTRRRSRGSQSVRQIPFWGDSGYKAACG